MLTAHQEEKFNEIKTHLKNGHKRIIVQGSAGTGKTFLAGEVAKFLKRDYGYNPNYNNGEVFVTAPTNKALAVLMSKVTAPVQFKTIHSALKLKLFTNNKTGKRSFVKAFSRKDEFRQCKAAMIDECSMLNTELEGSAEGIGEPVRGHLENYNFPIIYIGDDKQINPVGEPFSPVFHKNYPVVELTEIIRQGNGNPIIELSRDLDMIFFKTPKLIDGKGYVYDENKSGIIEALAEVNGTDEMKYLSFMNTDVDAMNKLVRERRYGNPKRIEKLETLVFNSPMGEFYTNREVLVRDVDIITAFIGVPRHDTKFDENDSPVGNMDSIRLKFYRINDAFNVIHEDSDTIFKSVVQTLTYNCAKLGWGWKGKYWFEEQFADIKYNHAITVHKSQGSTYKHSVLNIGNIMFNKNAEERTRLLYTGVTRASDLVILNNVK